MLVAEADGILAGYVVLSRQIRLHAGERGMDLHHFFVHQEWRGRGVGRRLIKTSIDLAEQLSCSYLTVATTVENKKAQQIYLAAGFALASPNGVRFRRQLEKGGKKNQG